MAAAIEELRSVGLTVPHIHPLVSPLPTRHPAPEPAERCGTAGRSSGIGPGVGRLLLLPLPAFAFVADGLSEQQMPLILY